MTGHCRSLVGQHRAGGDLDLKSDQIPAGDQLCHRMFHLESSVHLKEVKALILI